MLIVSRHNARHRARYGKETAANKTAEDCVMILYHFFASTDGKYVTNLDSWSCLQGCKWEIQKLRRYLTAKHGSETVESLFKEIDNIFVRSLQSVQKVIINDKHCFELYGYDILLDQDLKPYVGLIFFFSYTNYPVITYMHCLYCLRTGCNDLSLSVFADGWLRSTPLPLSLPVVRRTMRWSADCWRIPCT